MSKCKQALDNFPPCEIPKKEWDWLLKEGYLNKKQMKFLKKAESLGYEVEIRPRGIHSLAFEKYSWTESEITIKKKLSNKCK